MNKKILCLAAALLTLSYCLAYGQSSVIDGNRHYGNYYQNNNYPAFSPVTASFSLNHSLDSLKDQQLKRYRMYEEPYTKKSPAIAFALGFGPGFFIHGMGHYHIGEIRTGNALLALGVISTAVIVYAGPRAFFAGWDNPGNKNTPGVSFLLATGVITFMGTWVYDFTAAPIKARKFNEKHGLSMRLCPNLKGDMASLNIVMQLR